MSDALAVVVGIDHYPDQMLGPLTGAVNDAEAFAAWLQTAGAGNLTYDAGNLDQTEIHKVVTVDRAASPLSARPMVSDVEMALEYVKEKAETRLTQVEAGTAQRYRRLYLFFAGHGIGPDVEQAALLMANAGAGRFGHYVQGRPYANYFRSRAAFDEILLFMDCCRDAYPFIAAPPLKWDPPVAAGTEPNFCYAFATKWSKKSRETVVSGAARGYFSLALLEAVKGSAANANGVVAVDDVESYVAARVPMLVHSTQQPNKKVEIQDADFVYRAKSPIVIADYGAAAAPSLLTRVNVTLTPAEVGEAIDVLDGSLGRAVLVAESRPANNRWTFHLPFGPYKLRNAATNRAEDFMVLGPEDVNVTF